MLRVLFAALICPILAFAASPQLQVDGTRILVHAGGAEHHGAALEGAELDLGDLGVLRVGRVERDAEARFADEVWLLEGRLRLPGTSEFVNPCDVGGGTDRRMLLYAGYLDPQLRYVADRDRFSLSCLSGVEAKCLRWGYLPWKAAPIGGTSLAPYFEACVRMARADYCGDDQATTRDGTAIDISDHVGIQQPTPGLDEFEFEAGWNHEGATCVHHARIADNLDLIELPRLCPRLATAAIGPACTEAVAEAAGALIMTRSIPAKASAAGAAAQR